MASLQPLASHNVTTSSISQRAGDLQQTTVINSAGIRLTKQQQETLLQAIRFPAQSITMTQPLAQQIASTKTSTSNLSQPAQPVSVIKHQPRMQQTQLQAPPSGVYSVLQTIPTPTTPVVESIPTGGVIQRIAFLPPANLAQTKSNVLATQQHPRPFTSITDILSTTQSRSTRQSEPIPSNQTKPTATNKQTDNNNSININGHGNPLVYSNFNHSPAITKHAPTNPVANNLKRPHPAKEGVNLASQNSSTEISPQVGDSKRQRVMGKEERETPFDLPTLDELSKKQHGLNKHFELKSSPGVHPNIDTSET